MPSNGSSRKTPVSAKPVAATANFVSKAVLETGFSDSDRKAKLKLKSEASKTAPKAAKPGNWDSEVTAAKAKDTPTVPISGPVQDIALAFSHGRPLTDRADIVKCNHCKRAILRHKAKVHIESCIAKKQEKQRRKKEAKDARDAAARKAERGGVSSDSSDAEEDVTVNGIGASSSKKTARKTDAATAAVGGGQAGKKRKAEDLVGTGEPSKKKKKKDEPKAKVPKAKAPVDVERQCGVELPQGGQCARSLTCKSHSMGAKRAVPGRSAPYDKLLAEYQRKNQAKLQKAAMESQQPELDDLAQEGPVDSEDEKEAVLAAIARSRPRPLFRPALVPLATKYHHVRLKEMLGNALGGRGGGGLFSSAAAAANSATAATPATGLFGPSGVHAVGGGSVSAGGHRGSMPESIGGREGSVNLAREMSVQG